MDSLKTLLEKNQYDLVIKLTENSEDSLSLFYRIIAFTAVGQNENALNVIKTKREILKSKLGMLVKFHIEILCILGRFDEAYDELKIYEEMPYQSQEVEEVLRAMPAYIRRAEKESFGPRAHQPEDINVKLLSKNDEDVLAALDEIKSLPINDYLLSILRIIRSHPRQIIKTFALLLLVNAKYDKEVDFLSFGQMIKVTPSMLPEPFVVPGFKDIDEVNFALQKEYRDPTVAQNALQLLSSYLLYIYPTDLSLKRDETIVAFGYLAKKLLRISIDDLESVCKQKDLDYQIIDKTIKAIDEDLKNF